MYIEFVVILLFSLCCHSAKTEYKHSIYFGYGPFNDFVQRHHVNLFYCNTKFKCYYHNLLYSWWQIFRFLIINNRGEWNTILLYLGVWSTLSDFRRITVDKLILEEKSLVDILNGSEWPALYKYVLAEIIYRNECILIIEDLNLIMKI